MLLQRIIPRNTADDRPVGVRVGVAARGHARVGVAGAAPPLRAPLAVAPRPRRPARRSAPRRAPQPALYGLRFAGERLGTFLTFGKFVNYKKNTI